MCYLLGITDVDPLRFGLALDRFLHIGRPDLPDIDLDFDWRVRDEVIAHAFRRYGDAHTAMVSSHLFLQPRSAFREAGKIHGLSNEQITELAGEVGEEEDGPAHGRGGAGRRAVAARLPAGAVALAAAAARRPASAGAAAPPVRALRRGRHHAAAHRRVRAAPAGDEGGRHHAVRQGRGGGGRPGEDRPARQPGAGERRGNAAARRRRPAWAASHDDPRRAAAPPGRRHAGRQPAGVARHAPPAGPDATAGDRGRDGALALIRPGAACGRDEREVRPAAPRGRARAGASRRAGSLLRDTYGLPVYQDDALGVIRAFTGLSVPESHRLYKRATKKNLTEEQDRLLAKSFRRLCAGRGIPAETVAEQWLLLTHFRRYSFCKSHAVSYGLLAWQVVAAKAHRPLQFWAAVLNNNQGVYPRRVYVEAIRGAGFRVLLPCVNRSAEAFAPEGDDSIRTGLGAVATLPEEVRGRILAERDRGGPYGGLADFRRRVGLGPETLAALIRGGALDFAGRPRPALFLEADLQDRIKPQGPELLPCRPADDWSPPDYDAARRCADEQELLGFVADVPMLSLFRALLPPDAVRSIDLPRHKGRRVRVAGLVATGRFAYTEKGLEVQFITLEDEWGLMETTIFPGTCRLIRHLALGPYVAEGVVDEQFGVFSLTAERVAACLALVGQQLRLQGGDQGNLRAGHRSYQLHMPLNISERRGLGLPKAVTIKWSLALVAATNRSDRSRSSCSILAVGSPSVDDTRSGTTPALTPARIITGNSSPLTRCIVASRTPGSPGSFFFSSTTHGTFAALSNGW